MIAFFAPALAFLKRVPWPVYAALALLALWAWDRTAQYNEGRKDGRESVLAELRKAEAEAGEKALKAIDQADQNAAERAEAEAEVIERQLDAIERAEANDENPLDALFR